MEDLLSPLPFARARCRNWEILCWIHALNYQGSVVDRFQWHASDTAEGITQIKLPILAMHFVSV